MSFRVEVFHIAYYWVVLPSNEHVLSMSSTWPLRGLLKTVNEIYFGALTTNVLSKFMEPTTNSFRLDKFLHLSHGLQQVPRVTMDILANSPINALFARCVTSVRQTKLLNDMQIMGMFF